MKASTPLGILISTRLKSKDCKGLVDIITGRVRNWANKMLSFAGRALLVRSVLYCFIASNNTGLVFSYFQIWSGKDDHHGAKVVWDQLCLPLEEGGLGFRDVKL